MTFNQPAWEGICWVLDAVKFSPKRALNVIDTFLMTYLQYFTDLMICGMSDARAVILKRFVEPLGSRQVFDALRWDEFEQLCAYLFKAQGHKANRRGGTKDGGIDIEVVKEDGCVLAVQCRHRRDRSEVTVVRELLGVIGEEKAHGGIIISTSGFTRGALKEAARARRIALMGSSELERELRSAFGLSWLKLIRLFAKESVQFAP